MTRDQFEAAFIAACHEQDRMPRPVRALIDLAWEELDRRGLVPQLREVGELVDIADGLGTCMVEWNEDRYSLLAGTKFYVRVPQKDGQ